MSKRSELYHYVESGLPNVWLIGVQHHETIYGHGTSIPGVENLHRAIGISIAEANRQLTGAEVRFLRQELDLSQHALALLLGVKENTVRRWELGQSDIGGPARRALAGFYLESVKDEGSLRDLMTRFAETDREMTKMRLLFERHGDDWEPQAA